MAATTRKKPSAPKADAQPKQPEQADGPGGLATARAAYNHARKAAYRYRDALVPHGAVFGTLATGASLHALGVAGWHVLAAEAGAAAVASLFPGLRASVMRRPWLLGAAGLWLPLAAEIGAGGAMQTLLVGAGGLAAVPRIWRYRIRINRPVPKPKRLTAAETHALEAADPNVTIWDAKTARKSRGALPGSRLADPQPFEYGTRYRIILDGQTTEDAIGARKRVCADYGKRYEELHIEPTADQQLNAAELTILDRLAVEDVQQWTSPGLDPATGVLPTGPYADGRGDAGIQVWEPGSGPLPVGIFGAMRVGKSSLVKLAAVEFKRFKGPGKIKVIYMDPQRGQSAPALLPYVPHALGIDEIRATLFRLRDEMYARNAILKDYEWTDARGHVHRGKQSYDAPGMGGFDMLVGIVDESHRALAFDDIAECVFEILAEGSKCGITLWLLNQSALVDNIGGGQILNLLNSGNIVLLRTGDTYTAQATFGQRLEAYPHLIPKKFPNGMHSKGCGYVLGATDRPVMMRVRDIRDEEMHDAMGGEPMEAIQWLVPAVELASAPQRPATAPAVPAATGRAEAVSPSAPDSEGAEGEPDIDLDLDNVVDFTPIAPEEAADAEALIMRLLDGAPNGLDGADIAIGARLHPVIAFRVISDMTARGAVRQKGDRYVRAAS